MIYTHEEIEKAFATYLPVADAAESVDDLEEMASPDSRFYTLSDNENALLNLFASIAATRATGRG